MTSKKPIFPCCYWKEKIFMDKNEETYMGSIALLSRFVSFNITEGRVISGTSNHFLHGYT